MTTPPASQPEPIAPASSMRIHRLLSRGSSLEVQVLLALVSTPAPADPDEDVWVAINRTEPVTLKAEAAWAGIEAARPVTIAELQVLDLQWEEGELPFGLDDDTSRCHWLARFDFSDHETLNALWVEKVQQQDKNPVSTLDVVAWRSCLVHKPDPQGEALDFFEALPGHTHVSVPIVEVVAQPLFELGVLFVHGIGNHGVRETLVRWAEPIVKLWRDLSLAMGVLARHEIHESERHRITRWVLARQLRNRAPLDGICEVVNDFPTSSNTQRQSEAGKPLARPAAAQGVPCCSAIKTEQTLFSDVNPGQPSATLLRLSSVDTQAVLRESHLLFAEAYWTREAFPPTFAELYLWLTQAVPIAVWARLHRMFKVRPREIVSFARQTQGGFDRFRLAVSLLLWLVQILVMPAAYVLLALSSQLAIGLVGLVGLLPIPWLQSVTRSVVSALLGTLGQSFALQTSPIRRSAIVSAVRQNLDWLSEKCHRVVVLSHSQGAEISRLVFLDSRRNNIARWYTMGAGIAPLNMLHPRSLDQPAARVVVRASNLILAFTVVALCALALGMTPGLDLGVQETLARWADDLGLYELAMVYLLLWIALFITVGNKAGPEVRPQLRRSLLSKWHDIYSSHDPVPGGSLVDRFAAELRQLDLPVPKQSRIFNTRFGWFDHTSYFRNIEQFVAPVALDLLRLMGMGGVEPSEQLALAHAARRRDLLTWWNMLIYVLGTLTCALGFMWVAFGPPERWPLWLEQARLLWSQGSGTWEGLGVLWKSGWVGWVLTDLLGCLAVLVALAVWWCLRLLQGYRSERVLMTELAATLGHIKQTHPPTPPPPGTTANINL